MRPTLSTLLPALERADRGSLRLDLLIAYVVDGVSPADLRRIELFQAEDYSAERVAALLGYTPPAYTTRLDAALPEENIVLSMYAAAQARWAAIHRRPSGEEDLHWGATEPLARRIAALHAIAAANGCATANVIAGCDGVRSAETVAAADEPVPAPHGGGGEPWKILF
jgi:hypothetical protein